MTLSILCAERAPCIAVTITASEDTHKRLPVQREKKTLERRVT